MDPLTELRTIDDDLQARARAAGGAIYPDGFAVIGDVDDPVNIRVLHWDPNSQVLKLPEQIVPQARRPIPKEWHLVAQGKA